MKAIEYLERIKKMDAEIEENKLEVERLKTAAGKTTTTYGGEHVQSSGSQQKMADNVVNYSDLEREIEEETAMLIAHRQEARKIVKAACDSDCLKLISLRYFGKAIPDQTKLKYYKWEEIAVEMSFTYQWVSGGLHQRALAQVQKVLDERKGDQDGRNHENNSQT